MYVGDGLLAIYLEIVTSLSVVGRFDIEESQGLVFSFYFHCILDSFVLLVEFRQESCCVHKFFKSCMAVVNVSLVGLEVDRWLLAQGIIDRTVFEVL